jgi:hypothetical protein
MGEPEWGDWEKHDGACGPLVSCNQRIQVRMVPSEAEGKLTADDFEWISATFPGFFWRWKRVRTGWFKTELQRVCDDPAYAPIVAYRLRKPRSTAVNRLTEIVASPPGQWIKDDTDIDQRLPKRVPA